MRRGAVMLVVPVATLGLGYWAGTKYPVRSEVSYNGLFQVDTSRILSTTVESLRAENSLVVWSYKGTATVNVTRERWWIFKGHQKLIVPYTVSYVLDLNQLTYDKVDYNEKAQLVTVHLPRLGLTDIAFQPEHATTINGGVLTYSDQTVQELGQLAYKSARRGAWAQAQQQSMIDVAKAEAKKDVESYFEIPLRITGHPEIRVVATFS